MDHTFAVEHHLVEQYLLKELSPDVCDEFEDHYFDCVKCATDLRETDEFLTAVRAELQRPQLISSSSAGHETKLAGRPAPVRPRPMWRPVFAIAALAACLVVMIYQNFVSLPHLRTQVASLNQPEVIPTLSLVGGVARGGSTPTVALNGAKTLLLQVDIPAQDRFTGYICTLYSPQHEVIWTVPVSSAQAKDTISLRAPLRDHNGAGVYSLQVNGVSASTGAAAVELTNYSFQVSTDH
jgi:hypothetical protein